MMSTEKSSWFIHQSSLAILPAKSSGKSRRIGRRQRWISPCVEFCSYLQVLFTCCKIYGHGACGFTSHPKEGVLRIFIALKNQSPRPGLYSRALGQTATTLTITPPRRLSNGLPPFLSSLSPPLTYLCIVECNGSDCGFSCGFCARYLGKWMGRTRKEVATTNFKAVLQYLMGKLRK
jgi:hypothetical protein